jgi:hypothetical protein
MAFTNSIAISINSRPVIFSLFRKSHKILIFAYNPAERTRPCRVKIAQKGQYSTADTQDILTDRDVCQKEKSKKQKEEKEDKKEKESLS